MTKTSLQRKKEKHERIIYHVDRALYMHVSNYTLCMKAISQHVPAENRLLQNDCEKLKLTEVISDKFRNCCSINRGHGSDKIQKHPLQTFLC